MEALEVTAGIVQLMVVIILRKGIWCYTILILYSIIKPLKTDIKLYMKLVRILQRKHSV
jgi:hypothetical protein